MRGLFRQVRGALILTLLTLNACAAPSQPVASEDTIFRAAGFVSRPPGSTGPFVYADPSVCKCVYVGSRAANDRYRWLLRHPRIAVAQEMATQVYTDPGWNWGPLRADSPGFGR